MKASIGAALIVVPLLIAAAIAYWPTQPTVVTTVVIPPPDVHGHVNVSELAQEVPLVLSEQLHEAPKLKVQITGKDINANEAAAFDAVIITTLTEDAGIVQLNVQVVSPRTRSEIWNNSYQSPHRQFRDMLRVAGDGVRRALD